MKYIERHWLYQEPRPVICPPPCVVVMPEGAPLLSSDWPVAEPLVSSNLPRSMALWSWFLNAGISVSCCLVLKATLFDEPSYDELTPASQFTVRSSCG